MVGKTVLYVVSPSLKKERTAISYFGFAKCQVRIYLYFEGQRFLKTPVKLKPDTSMGLLTYWQTIGVSSRYRI